MAFKELAKILIAFKKFTREKLGKAIEIEGHGGVGMGTCAVAFTK